jgi:hypothetical protein
MIVFNVVKEEYGWSVRMGEAMTTPFWSRTLAIREADSLAQAIRRHGESAQVIVEGAVPADSSAGGAALTSVTTKALVGGATSQ